MSGVTPIETTCSDQVTLEPMVTWAAVDAAGTWFDLPSAQQRSGVQRDDPVGRNASLHRRVSMPDHE